MKKQCKDHLGNVYPSFTSMCKMYGMPVKTVGSRLKRGTPLEIALTRTNLYSSLKPWRLINGDIIDHYGNKYVSVKELANKFNLTTEDLVIRARKGWDLKKILETEKNTRPFTKDGKNYKSVTEYCEQNGIDRQKVYSKKYCNGLKTLRDSVESVLDVPCDHCGNRYPTVKAMCENYNIRTNVFYGRLNNGWNLEEALTIPRYMYIGEYRVSECLKRLNVAFYYNCSLKKIFKDFDINVDWNTFLSELKDRLEVTGIKWSKSKIEKLRPDFTLYTDDNNKIIGVIEFDGEQHQNFVEYFFKTIEEFLRRSNADFVKQDLWEYLKIPMLRIRHDQVDMIEDMITDLLNNPNKYLTNHNTYLSEDEYWEPLRETKERLDITFAT